MRPSLRIRMGSILGACTRDKKSGASEDAPPLRKFRFEHPRPRSSAGSCCRLTNASPPLAHPAGQILFQVGRRQHPLSGSPADPSASRAPDSREVLEKLARGFRFTRRRLSSSRCAPGTAFARTRRRSRCAFYVRCTAGSTRGGWKVSVTALRTALASMTNSSAVAGKSAPDQIGEQRFARSRSRLPLRAAPARASCRPLRCRSRPGPYALRSALH